MGRGIFTSRGINWWEAELKMVKLVLSGDKNIGSICPQLKSGNPDWVVLDKDTIKGVTNRVLIEKVAPGQTFIVHGDMVNPKQHASNINKLLAYMVSSREKWNWNFIIVASALERVDKRIRGSIDETEDWVGI